MLLLVACAPPARAAETAPAPPPPAAALVQRASSTQQVWNGVVSAPDGRLFVVLPRLANPAGPSLALVDADDRLVPFPDAAWNDGSQPASRPQRPQSTGSQPSGPQSTGSKSIGSQPTGPQSTGPQSTGSQPTATQAGDPGPVFVGLNAIRLAPDGAMWAVDTGVPGPGKAPVVGGARLIRIDLATNQVTRILPVPAEALRPKSMIDDIRFNGNHAYVTDSGMPGLLVVDLRTGAMRRVLDHDPALTAQRPITVDGEVLKGPDNKPVMIHADQLEVSPDGRHLYVQPLCGPMSRIDTALLDDPQTPARTLSAGISFWYDTPALGGTAIAPDGTLYLNDLENDSILALSPDRVLTQLVRDGRLHWADAPFLSTKGTLFVPVPQLDRAAFFHHGHAQIQFPVSLFTLDPQALAEAARGRAARPGTAPASAPGAPAAPAQR